MRNVIIGALILAILVMVARHYHPDQFTSPTDRDPAGTSATSTDPTCDQLTKLFRDKGYTVDQCVTENTVPDYEQSHHVAHT